MVDSFDIHSLAAQLRRPAKQIRKLADRGLIPCRRVGGEWRFDRTDIFHWMESHIGSAQPDDLRQLEILLADGPGARDVGTLAARLPPELVWIGCPARTRTALVHDFCGFAVQSGYLWDGPTFIAAINAREALHSTALENGVALLHPRRPLPQAFADPFLALATTPGGIPFGGPRGAMTDVFFLIASASEPDHLHTLARLSRLLNLPDALDRLRECTTPREACHWMHECESRLDSPAGPRS